MENLVTPGVVLRVMVGDGAQAAAPAVVQGKAPAPAAATPPAPIAAAPAAAAAAGTGPSVTFAPGKTYPFGKSGNMLDLALAKRVRIKYECKVGDCGKCRVEVTAGAEHLNARTGAEDKALRMIGHAEPENRLACMVTEVAGPVAVHSPK
jgi:ferredoxin